MFLERAKKLFQRNKVKINSVLLEILLIFIGVTISGIFADYIENSKDNKFIKENLKLYRKELIDNNKVNNLYYSLRSKNLLKLKEFNEMVANKNLNENDLKNFTNSINFAVTGGSISNNNYGYKNIINKDINLIKNTDFKNSLLDFNDFLIHNIEDFETANQYNRLFKNNIENYIRYDYKNRVILSTKNLQNIKKDFSFLNRLNDIILYEEMRLEMLKYTVKRSEKMIKLIDNELNS